MAGHPSVGTTSSVSSGDHCMSLMLAGRHTGVGGVDRATSPWRSLLFRDNTLVLENRGFRRYGPRPQFVRSTGTAEDATFCALAETPPEAVQGGRPRWLVPNGLGRDSFAGAWGIAAMSEGWQQRLEGFACGFAP